MLQCNVLLLYVGVTLDDLFSPQLFTGIPYWHFHAGRGCVRYTSNLIKSREHNVQNVTVSLKCSYFVSDDGVRLHYDPNCFSITTMFKRHWMALMNVQQVML